jgi:16S rRNA (uracil1498-N3)-methyltransferase
MRQIRIHVDFPLAVGAEVTLPESAAEHVVRVLRLRRGEPIVLFNGDGREYPAKLVELGKRAATAVIHAVAEVDREPMLRLTLAQSIARGEKMDWILQKATELGVARVVPLLTERTEVRLDQDRAARRLAHWRGVIAAACEQCGRNRLPTLETPQRLDRWLAELTGDALRLALLPDGESTLRRLPPLQQGVILVVGPEGGLSEQDARLLHHGGFRGLRLGPRTLRTETAALAALAALQALYGDG